MKIIVVGASGFIGQRLVPLLTARGDSVVVTGRDESKLKKTFRDGVTTLQWDPSSGPLPVGDADAVINLAGEPVAKGRWTDAKKKRIRESRITGTRNVVEGMKAAGENGPKTLVQASAIGWYGDTKHNWVTEGSPPADDFLGEVCVAWEAEAAKAREAGIRTPIVRIGVVLGKGGGAYPLMTRPFRMFAGGKIGLGRGWFSWIHLDDVVGILMHVLDAENARGVYNATAPNPVSNGEFTKVMGKVLRRPTLFPVPPQALRVVLGEFAQVVTASQRVRPLRTIGVGYEYKYPFIEGAVRNLEGKEKPAPAAAT